MIKREKGRKVGLSKFIVATIIASSFSMAAFAANGDIYKLNDLSQTAYTKASTANFKTQRTIGLHSEDYGYEVSNKIYKFDDLTEVFIANNQDFTKTLVALPNVKTSVGDAIQSNILIGVFDRDIFENNYVVVNVPTGKTVKDVLVNGISKVESTDYIVTGTKLRIFVTTSKDTIKITTTDGIVYVVKVDITENTAPIIKSVSAINGKVNITFDSALTSTPSISDFAVTQTIGSTNATIIPMRITMDSTMKMATLTVPTVEAISSEQSVVYGISYKNSTIINSTVFAVESKTDENTTLSVKDINNKYGDSVVYIQVQDINHKVIASGSGFIVNLNGTLVTNFHVIKGCAYANVTLQNGTKYDVKSVLNYNENQDIAILQLENASNLCSAVLGDSSLTEVTDPVVAIGSPLGLQNTVSTGMVSGLNRTSITGRSGKDIQIDAPITHGSSGGALFNMMGQVIGITYAGESTGNYNFAIPINEVKPFFNGGIEKTLIEVNNIQINTTKFFPLLSDVPQPTGISYDKVVISGNVVTYEYSILKLPSTFVSDYNNLLEQNGWIYHKSEKINNYTAIYFTKGNNVILITLLSTGYFITMGTIH
ncbi:S1C family serine protease [Clostridium sp.]|uniref:S1C family serine protease n=1 Tax=Clostridium sp. TaxID=1506 RepID=UPI003D6D33EC